MILQKDDKSGWNAWQAFLVTQGFTGLACDGIPGPATERATRSFQSVNGLDADGIVGDATLAAATAKGFGGLDCGQTDAPLIITEKPVTTPADSHIAIFPVSDRITQINSAMLSRVSVQLQVKVRGFIAAAAEDGVTLQIVQGLRTFAEQDALYAQGRSKAGKIVTNAKGGQSLHNYGCACDLAPVVNGAVSWDDHLFQAYEEWAKIAGLEWGGSWAHFKDMPHVQWTNRMTLGQIQAAYRESGLPAVWARLG